MQTVTPYTTLELSLSILYRNRQNEGEGQDFPVQFTVYQMCLSEGRLGLSHQDCGRRQLGGIASANHKLNKICVFRRRFRAMSPKRRDSPAYFIPSCIPTFTLQPIGTLTLFTSTEH